MTDYPILCYWHDDMLRPANWTVRRRAREQFTEGELYQIQVVSPRSEASHNHYFAALHEAWLNLPEHLAARFPTAEHLRKYALIHTGYRNERSYVCKTRAQAVEVAAFVQPMDEFAVVSLADLAVIVWTAKSQSRKSMDRAEFQVSKDAVLDLVASMIGVTKDELAPRGVSSTPATQEVPVQLRPGAPQRRIRDGSVYTQAEVDAIMALPDPRAPEKEVMPDAAGSAGHSQDNAPPPLVGGEPETTPDAVLTQKGGAVGGGPRRVSQEDRE